MIPPRKEPQKPIQIAVEELESETGCNINNKHNGTKIKITIKNKQKVTFGCELNAFAIFLKKAKRVVLLLFFPFCISYL